MSEDISYVNLSLQKYNELYEKAKKYDEMCEFNQNSENHIPRID